MWGQALRERRGALPQGAAGVHCGAQACPGQRRTPWPPLRWHTHSTPARAPHTTRGAPPARPTPHPSWPFRLKIPIYCLLLGWRRRDSADPHFLFRDTLKTWSKSLRSCTAKSAEQEEVRLPTLLRGGGGAARSCETRFPAGRGEQGPRRTGGQGGCGLQRPGRGEEEITLNVSWPRPHGTVMGAPDNGQGARGQEAA